MNSLLKDGEELFIKMQNGQFKKVNEVINTDNALVQPRIKELEKTNNIKFNYQGNNHNFNLDEINRELMNCLNQGPVSTPCKFDNFSIVQKNSSLVPQLNSNQKQICQQVQFSDQAFQGFNSLMKDQQQNKLNESQVEFTISVPLAQPSSVWLDEHLLAFIQAGFLESHNLTLNSTDECNLEETELYANANMMNRHK